jgi:dTDP-D-glucose 4,6-dehydratase
VRLLATGGAGFIRSNDVRRALGHTADEVTVHDALTYALLIAQGSPSA